MWGGGAGWTPPSARQPENFLGIVKEMAGKWILGGVLPGGPKRSGWVGRLDPSPQGSGAWIVSKLHNIYTSYICGIPLDLFPPLFFVKVYIK